MEHLHKEYYTKLIMSSFGHLKEQGKTGHDDL